MKQIVPPQPEVPYLYSPQFSLETWSDYGCWVAHVKSRQEKAFAKDLCQKRIPYFLPQQLHEYISGGRKRRNWLPLFSGYVFFCGGKDMCLEAYQTNRLVKVIEVPVSQAQVHCQQMSAISQALDAGIPLLVTELKVGQRCRVVDGALAGQEGIVVQSDNENYKVQLKIQMLGQAIEAHVQMHDVKII